MKQPPRIRETNRISKAKARALGGPGLLYFADALRAFLGLAPLYRPVGGRK